MIGILLIRTSYLKTGTAGQILDQNGKPVCLTLERPWVNNEPNVSCVPTGIYGMELDMRHPGTEKEILVWELRGVEGRTQIQIHPGNKIAHSLGCILPCSSLAAQDDELFGSYSRKAFDSFMDMMGDEKNAEIIINESPYKEV